MVSPDTWPYVERDSSLKKVVSSPVSWRIGSSGFGGNPSLVAAVRACNSGGRLCIQLLPPRPPVLVRLAPERSAQPIGGQMTTTDAEVPQAETQEKASSFAKSLFLGEIHEDLVFPYPYPDEVEGRKVKRIVRDLKEFAN